MMHWDRMATAWSGRVMEFLELGYPSQTRSHFINSETSVFGRSSHCRPAIYIQGYETRPTLALSPKPLTIGLGGIVTVVDNQVLRLVVVLAGKVAGKNSLGTGGVTGLSIDRGTGHVRNHGVSTSPWVLGVTERVVLGSGLREPDITTVTTEVTRLESIGNILLDDNGTTSGVDEP